MSAVRLPLDSVLSPEQAVLSLRGDSRPFALVGDWFSGVCVLGSEPVCVAGPDEDPFSVLERMPQLATDLTGDLTRTTGGLPSGASGSPMPLVGGGWVGWLGYRLGALIQRLPLPPPAPVPMPPFSLAFDDHAVVFDGERWWFEALWSEARSAVLRARLAVWEGRLAGRPAPPDEAAIAAAMTSPFTLAGCGAAGHVTAVAECRQRIAAGELFQANLCLRLESRLSGSALDLFARALPLAGPASARSSTAPSACRLSAFCVAAAGRFGPNRSRAPARVPPALETSRRHARRARSWSPRRRTRPST